MEAISYNTAFMGPFQGLCKVNDASQKMILTGMMDRGFTVLGPQNLYFCKHLKLIMIIIYS
jgi:hypothetical protein